MLAPEQSLELIDGIQNLDRRVTATRFPGDELLKRVRRFRRIFSQSAQCARDVRFLADIAPRTRDNDRHIIP